MTTAQDAGAVSVLDLRTGATALDTPAALRSAVAEQLDRAGATEPDQPLFLVIDTPAGLMTHVAQYELLTGYRAEGRNRILLLLTGSAPGSGREDDDEDSYPPDHRLVRPAVLRDSGIGVLWAGDLRLGRTGADRQPPDHAEALAVLVELLSVVDVFDQVLTALSALPDAVAAPGVRLLEQDLPAAVRDRAWRDALLRFAGADSDPAAGTGSEPAWSDADLPEPLRRLLTGRPAHRQGYRVSGGHADLAHHECDVALADADEALDALRSVGGLLGSTAREDFEDAQQRAHHSLGDFRGVVETALSGGGVGSPTTTAEAADRLAALGVRIPSAEGVGEQIGESLHGFAAKLLGEGLALRSVAHRFTRLAGRVEPLPASALLPRTEEHSARAVAERAARQDGPPPGSAAGGGAAAFAAGLLGGLWPPPGTALAVLVPLLLVAVGLLGASRLPGSGRFARWAVAPAVAAAVGAVVGGAAALASSPPPLLGVVGLLVGLGVAAEVGRRGWRAAVGRWAHRHRTAEARRALDGLDALLGKAVREQWAADERLYCADAARSVAGMMRATAAAAEEEAAPEPASRPSFPAAASSEDDDWLTLTSTLETVGPGAADDVDQDTDWASAYAWENRPSWDETGTSGAGAGLDGIDPAVRGDAFDKPLDPWEERPAEPPRWLDRESGDGGPGLVATLAGDLTDAAMVALAPYWGAVERGQAGAHAVQRTEERVRDLLSAARLHLRRNGVLAVPPFAAEHRVRGASAGLLGTDPRRVADLVCAEADRHSVVQLLSPEQSILLSRDPATEAWLRFAPRAVRAEAEHVWPPAGPVQPDDVRWTSSGRYAGLLRLVPLRVGVVQTVRSRHSAGADLSDGFDGWEAEQW